MKGKGRPQPKNRRPLEAYRLAGRSRQSRLPSGGAISSQFPLIIEAVLTDEDKQWISGQLEKVDTTLLTEFHKWASPVELRQKSHAAALHALDVEVESLSDRLKNLEGR